MKAFTQLGLGTAGFGPGSPVSKGISAQRDADRIVHAALDLGLNYVDTADVYSDGDAETMLGKALRTAGTAGSSARIGTKVGLAIGPGSAADKVRSIVGSVESSLRRLDVESIDVLSLHAYDSGLDPNLLCDALSKVHDAGKFHYFGVSNYSALKLADYAAAFEDSPIPVAANQVYYNLLCRDPEWEMLGVHQEYGIDTFVWSPLAWGRLTGRVTPSWTPGNSRLTQTAAYAPPVDPQVWQRVDSALNSAAAASGLTVPQLAVGWVSARQTVSTTILGPRTVGQLSELVEGVTKYREADVDTELTSASQPEVVSYPYFQYRVDPFMSLWPTARTPGVEGP